MPKPDEYDFCGWASKNNLRCADGRIIRKDAFSVNDGQRVPLVWNHQHKSSSNVLGHAILENRAEGVYTYGKFNNSQAGQDAKEAVRHGDVTAMSIWANNLDQQGSEVFHGVIREVSLVLAGANPGAFIESVIVHGEPMEDGDEEGIFYTGDDLTVIHAIEDEKLEEKMPEKEEKKEGGKTVKDVFDTLNEEQKKAVAIIVGQAISDGKAVKDDEEEEEEGVKHNVFDNNGTQDDKDYISHAELIEAVHDVRRYGSLRASFKEHFGTANIMHSIDTTGMTVATGTQTYGFNDPNMLFPDYKSLNTPPEWLSRNMDWVTKLLAKVHHTPFSRIKSVYADITEDEARARGYIKGKQKKTEVFTTLKRTTDPQTIYKLQKMDRDDVLDITEFDVIAWIRAEMRVMLNEEIARAILMGDGRDSDAEDKIQELHIRPVISDVPLFNVVVTIHVSASATKAEVAEQVIDEVIRARRKWKGTGKPDLWTTDEWITEMLLIKNKIGDKVYKTEAELATTLRVSEIIPVEPMEGKTVTYEGKEYELLGTIINFADYNVGTDKGGEINNFEDFDIDYNQHKYLIETRFSGALVKPFSALTILIDRSGTGSASVAD